MSAVLVITTLLTSLPLYAFAGAYRNASDAVSDDPSERVELVKDSYELIELREENVKHFRLEDGSTIAAQYEVPIHYLDEGGRWQDIDNTLSSVGSEYATSDAKIKFAKKITGNESLFTLHDGNRKLTLSLDGAIKKTTGTATNPKTSFDESATTLQKMMTLDKLSSEITYAGILDGVDLQYVVGSGSVKENILVCEKQDSYSYTFTLKLNNLEAVLSADGSVRILDDSDDPVYEIPAPIVFDSSDQYAPEGNAAYTLDNVGSGRYKLTVSVDAEWMNAPERVYPVTVDPTIYYGGHNLGQMRDTFVSSKKPTTANGSSTTLRVGYDTTYGYTRSYVALKTLPTLPKNAYITSAKLNLQLYEQRLSHQLYLGASPIDFGSTSMWAESEVTWNTHPAQFTDWLDYLVTESTRNTYSWDITSIAREWYAGSSPALGIAIGLIEETGESVSYIDFYSSENKMFGSTTYTPFYCFSYRDMKGWSPIGVRFPRVQA